uniref:Pentatricopeptide repeat-containing protein n=1 Tax=Ananas comosus var. bracteatus TaxID=296719 RepID=A0A6V7PRB7_ANACO|nr:unnamed protein product [Ananas comosus var. bracteatus]
MARNSLRAAAAAARGWLGAAAGPEREPLRRRILAVGGAAALDRWLGEGPGAAVTAPYLMKRVRELRRYGRHNHALEIMDWMEKRGMEITHGGHAVRLDLIWKTRGIAPAEEYFSTLPNVAEQQRTYGALLNCYCSERMTEKATAHFEKMKELSLHSSAFVYNNIMSLYMKSGEFEKVPFLFDEMKTNNITPDNCTYRILIKSYASMNNIDYVDRAIQEMEGNRGALDWSTYCLLGSIYISAGLLEKAVIAVKKAELVMDRDDLSPFRFFISLYANAGNLAEVKRVWDLLKARVRRPANVHYRLMLQALAKLDDVSSLKKCFEEWESGAVNYDMRLANIVIDAYTEKEMVEEAKLLQEKASKMVEVTNLSSA